MTATHLKGTRIRILPTVGTYVTDQCVIEPGDILVMDCDARDDGVRVVTTNHSGIDTDMWLYPHEYEIIAPEPFKVEDWTID